MQHWPETIECFCSLKMGKSKRKPKPGKPVTQVSGARMLRSAANTSQVTHSIRLAIYVYATDALVHSGACPTTGTHSKSAHHWQHAGGKRGRAKDRAFSKESPCFRVIRGTEGAFCGWQALTSTQQQSTAQGLLGPSSQWLTSMPQTPASVFTPQPPLVLLYRPVSLCTRLPVTFVRRATSTFL